MQKSFFSNQQHSNKHVQTKINFWLKNLMYNIEFYIYMNKSYENVLQTTKIGFISK